MQLVITFYSFYPLHILDASYPLDLILPVLLTVVSWESFYMQLQSRNNNWQKVFPSQCLRFSTFWTVTWTIYSAMKQTSLWPARHSWVCHSMWVTAQGKLGSSSQYSTLGSLYVSLCLSLHKPKASP